MLASRVAEARTLHGFVFDDRDRDGRPAASEPGIADAVVSFGGNVYTITDARGRFALEIPDGATGIAWVRVPEGFAPGPVFAHVGARTDSVDLALRAIPPLAGPLTFVVASDTHLSAAQPFGLDLREVATAATSLDPAPAFVTITGDITQGGTAAEYALVDASLAGIDLPYVPVAGNHDWYDGGDAWFARYGPDNYSFDIGGVHFIVWNMAMSEDDIASYLHLELARVDRAMPIVALTHAPPSPAVVARLRALGVDYVFTGHTHTNHVVDHDGLIELNTEPMLMGGLDLTPAGYRIVTIVAGHVTSEHRTVVAAPHVEVLAPAPGACAHAGDPLVVAAAADASAMHVVATLDCATPVELASAGGWDFRTALPELAPGPHALAIEARATSGAIARAATTIEICDDRDTAPIAGAWTQLGGGPAHDNARAREVVPPLVARWTTPVGGHVLQAPPVVGGGAVFVAVTDLADGDAGGVVALDLATGATRWRHPTRAAIRGGVALVRELVVATLTDGSVLALDAATGATRWQTSLAGDLRAEAAGLFGAPAIVDGDVFVANQHRFTAIDAASGTPRWIVDPMKDHPFDFATDGAIAIDRGLAIGGETRALGGIAAFDRETGALAWRFEGLEATGANASPLLAGDTAFVLDGADEVTALDVETGAPRWTTWLDETGFEWGEATPATPAFARGTLVVPTLYDDLVALDGASGAELWRAHASAASPLRTAHYRGAGMRGFEASPVIAGSIVWSIDTAGELAARDLEHGSLLWRTALGAPVLAGPAIVGDALVVASFDGTVRLLAPAHPRPALAAPSCAGPAPRGGCCAVGGSPDALAIAVALLAMRRRRVRR